MSANTHMWASWHDKFLESQEVRLIERIFSIVGVLTSLRCCQLGLDNLDALVMICKNWPHDACAGCLFTLLKKMW
jgi:hypothetical protein